MRLTGKPVIVLGMYRGGTSSVAGALVKAGVDFGPESDLFEASEFNQGGFFESKTLAGMFTGLTQAMRRHLNDFEPLPETWQDIPYLRPFAKSLKESLVSTYQNLDLWGWKDPRTSVAMPLVNQVLKELEVEPTFVIPCRHPISVLKSSYHERIPNTAVRIGHWARYMLGGLVGSIGHRRTVIVYEHMIQDPKEVLERAFSVIDGVEATPEVVASIRREWAHQSYTPEELKQVPSLFLQIYDYCVKVSQDLDGLNAGDYDAEILELNREVQRTYDALRGIPMPTCLARGSRPVPNGLATKSVEYTPKEGWEILEIPVPDEGAPTALFSIYEIPAKVWIRKAQWLSNGEVVGRMDYSPGAAGHLGSEEGYDVLWTLVGDDQITASVPAGRSSLVAQFEVCVQTNMAITAQSFASLSKGYYRAISELRAMREAQFRASSTSPMRR